MNPIERSLHPTSAQVDSLVEFMQHNPSLARGFLRTASGRDSAHRQWEQLSLQLNSIGGSIKTWKQWAKIKKCCEKKGMLRSAARRRTGGGNEQVPELSEVEERIISVMGGEGFYEGDRHLAIQLIHEPVPSTSALSTEEAPTLQMQLQDESQNIIIENIILETIPEQVSRESITGAGVAGPSTGSSTSTLSIFDTRRRRRLETQLAPPEPDTVPPSRPDSRMSPVRQAFGSPSSLTSPRHAHSTPRRSRRRLQASPPSQRRAQLSSLSERFLRVEEQRLDFDRRNARWNHERDRMLEAAFTRMGDNLSESLRLLAEALNKQ